jgi:single-stranded DNA-binding protein
MLVKANIGTTVEMKTSQNGKKYCEFRAAENTGKNESQTTTWYTVRAFIEEHLQELLGRGDFVEIEGKLLADAYMKKDGSGPAASLTILAFRVEPAQRGGGNRAAGNNQAGGFDNNEPTPPSDRPVYEHQDDDIPF